MLKSWQVLPKPARSVTSNFWWLIWSSSFCSKGVCLYRQIVRHAAKWEDLHYEEAGSFSRVLAKNAGRKLLLLLIHQPLRARFFAKKILISILQRTMPSSPIHSRRFKAWELMYFSGNWQGFLTCCQGGPSGFTTAKIASLVILFLIQRTYITVLIVQLALTVPIFTILMLQLTV